VLIVEFYSRISWSAKELPFQAGAKVCFVVVSCLHQRPGAVTFRGMQ